jgi:ATP-dependent protease Clp, ATPase subunit
MLPSSESVRCFNCMPNRYGGRSKGPTVELGTILVHPTAFRSHSYASFCKPPCIRDSLPRQHLVIDHLKHFSYGEDGGSKFLRNVAVFNHYRCINPKYDLIFLQNFV